MKPNQRAQALEHVTGMHLPFQAVTARTRTTSLYHAYCSPATSQISISSKLPLAPQICLHLHAKIAHSVWFMFGALVSVQYFISRSSDVQLSVFHALSWTGFNQLHSGNCPTNDRFCRVLCACQYSVDATSSLVCQDGSCCRRHCAGETVFVNAPIKCWLQDSLTEVLVWVEFCCYCWPQFFNFQFLFFVSLVPESCKKLSTYSRFAPMNAVTIGVLAAILLAAGTENAKMH